MRVVLSFAIGSTLLLACSSAPHRHHDADVVSSTPEPYVRLVNIDSNTLELQIAARKFVPAHGKGPTIWLTGVSHIANPIISPVCSSTSTRKHWSCSRGLLIPRIEPNTPGTGKTPRLQ